MPAMEAENPKVGGCYIWFISCLLFVFTVSGAIFLVLYMIQPESTPSTYWYPIIGVSLVCLPWFFWLLTFLYRIVSRAFGFRFICFGPFGSSGPDDDTAPAANGGGGNGLGLSTTVTANTTGGGVSGGGGGAGGEGKPGNQDGNENGESGIARQPGNPRRVHFGGVVIIGDENEESVDEEKESPRASSSSSASRQSNESETPLRLAMA